MARHGPATRAARSPTSTRPISAAQALGLLHTIGSALTAAHHRGVLHCDVKPGNILVSAYGQPALSDFGIARIALESQGSRIGGYTLDHVPSEILRGDHPTDRGDVYSLGTTVFQLLEGRPPFRAPDDVSAVNVMRRIAESPFPALSRRDLPAGLSDLLRAMTVKDPAARPTAAAVSTRASDIASQAGLPLTSAMPAHPRAQAAVSTMLPPTGPSISGPPPPDPGLSGHPQGARTRTTGAAEELDAPTNALRSEPGAPPPRPRLAVAAGVASWPASPSSSSSR